MQLVHGLKTRATGIATAILLFPVLLIGCAHSPPAHENLPAYAWTDDHTALRELAARAHAIRTVSAAALLTLTRPNGESVRLDGAMAVSLPDKSVRLRAWKLSQAVFDLTLTPGGLWIETPKDPAHHEQIAPASLSAAGLARAISIFGGEVFEGPRVRVTDHGGSSFQVLKTLDSQQIMAAEIERSTLVVLHYRLMDLSGAVRFELTLNHYQLFNRLAWPTRLIARSDNGAIELELRDVELNGELPAGAFVPPRGAKKA